MLNHVYTCDHCGKKLHEMVDFCDLEIDAVSWFKCDMCNDCARHLEDMVLEFCGKKQEVRDGQAD